MQRVFRQPHDEKAGSATPEDFARLLALLKNKLPSATIQTFAQPKLSEESTNWLSELGGQPQPLSALPAEQAQAAQSLLNERQQGIRELAARLKEQDASAQEVAWLYALAQSPEPETVYVLNGQPVIVGWPSKNTIDPTSIPPATAVAAPAASLAGNGGSGGITDVSNNGSNQPGGPRRWPWLLLLLLLLLLALGWWLWKSGWIDELFPPDPVVMLEEQLRQNEEDCTEIERILREHPLFVTPPEDQELADRLTAVKTTWQRKMLDCYLSRLARLQQQIEAAQNCSELEAILSQAELLKRTEPQFVAVRVALVERIQLCHVQRLSDLLLAADGDCAALRALIDSEPALKTPEQFFTAEKVTSSSVYRQMVLLLEKQIADCVEQEKEQLAEELRQKLDQITDCDELKQALETWPLLQHDDPVFVEIRNQALERLQACIAAREQAERDRLEAERKRKQAEKQQAIDRAASKLQREIKANQNDCDKLKAMAENESLWSMDAPEIRALRKQVQDLLANCKDRVIENAKNLCPGERPPELAPEFVLAFDGSGSMGYSMNISRKQHRIIKGINLPLPDIFNTFPSDMFSEPTRITTAKRAAESVVTSLPSDTNAGLVVFDDCPSARNEGYYAPSQRQRMLSRINRLKPFNGTPLASAVRKSGQMVDGVSREAVIVLISDGEESCGKDPCAEARRLKAAKPRVKVNVVDIMGTGAANCVARITGGRVFTARNAAEVAKMTKRAAAEAIGPARCQP